MKTMAEVLAEHWSASTHTDSKPPVDKCDGCGVVLRAWGDGSDMPSQLAAHQAESLADVGYGPVKAAGAQALRDAAEFADDPSPEDMDSYFIDQADVGRWLRARADDLDAP